MSESKLNEFDAAKKIVETLSAVEKDKRVQVLRWVAESAGIAETGPAIAPKQTPSEVHAEIPGSYAPPTAAPDVKTFVNEKNPKNDVQFATVVAYYYRFQAAPGARKETIGPDDLQEAARMAGRTRFRKPAIPLANASTLGYLNRAGGGQFSINSVGENLVAMTLPGTNNVSKKRLKPNLKKRALNTKSKSK